MDSVYYLDSNNDRLTIDMVSFQNIIAGTERRKDLWPKTFCLSCENATFASGIVTPNPDFIARFVHYHDPDNPETCPLGAKSARFGSLGGKSIGKDPTLAKKVKQRFLEFDNLKKAYLVCRTLRGGKGKLSQKDFIKMVSVADSFGIWGYQYMPDWGIPLLLMLMTNHPTPNGKSEFFYVFKKDRSQFSQNLWSRNLRLEAHWVSDSSLIAPPKNGVNPAFLHTINFKESTYSDILKGQDLEWWSPDNLTQLVDFIETKKTI